VNSQNVLFMLQLTAVRFNYMFNSKGPLFKVHLPYGYGVSSYYYAARGLEILSLLWSGL
jgi:hypothetical protein